MGDMKTPDFDDLLAAFDIPDIDAKEAIQSDPEVHRDEQGPGVHDGSAAPQSEPSGVSVIVKNTVRPETAEHEDKPVRDKAGSPLSALASQVPVKLQDLTSDLGPKLSAGAAVEPQITNGFEEGQSNTQSWSQSSPFTSTTMDTSSSPPSAAAPCLSPHLPPHDEADPPDNPLSPLMPQNANLETDIKRVLDKDEDDSEPDLGSPLVIQESPESGPSSPPKFKRRAKLHPDLLGSHDNTSCLVSPPPPDLSSPNNPKAQDEDDGQPSTPSSPIASPQKPQGLLSAVDTSSAVVREEKYPEHVIDERDSPESPPPSETGLVFASRNSSPDLDLVPALNQEKLNHQEELIQGEHSQEEEEEEEKSGDAEDLSDKMTEEREKANEADCRAGSEDASASDVAETASSPLRPLKVKIKMPTRSITRTVTGLPPKRSGKAAAKETDCAKPSPERHNTKSKKEQSNLPAAANQDAASACKEKPPAEAKAKVSPTAVSITKTAALPSISSSSRTSPSAVNLRSLGQKTLTSASASLTALPAQSGSKPASIVNSTGAIISKSQTNLVEAFNKILNNKNLLPSYKPDLSSPLPAEWGLSLPAQGYRCLECGDAFALEQSLAQHYDRRSLRIEVTCNHCAKRLAFFNKCSLLLHAREHKEKGLIMQCSHLVMKPVPVDQMISQQEPGAAAPTSSSSVSGQSSFKIAPQTHHAAGSKKEAEAVQHAGNKCPECQAQFGSKEEVSDHFQEIKPAHSTSCTECSPPMLLPNSCSAAAHQRSHQGGAPHVCPECGGTVKQPLFQKHLLETCLHFSRRIGYRCSSCLVVFGGLNSVKSHIQQAHCDMFHKCPSCPMAFKFAPSIQSHISSRHPDLTDGQAMLIYKCVMCDTVFTHKPLLYSHFDTHLTNQKVHVFKCPECTKLFSQRSSLLDHFKMHKAPTLKEEQPSSAAASSRVPVKLESSEEEWMGKEKAKAERVKTPSGWKCRSCSTQFTEREDYISHMSEQHGKILKKFPCNKCESSFTTTSSMRRHIRDKHKIMNRGFRCQFCSDSKRTFSSRAMLERHVQLRHSMSPDTLMRADEAESSSEQDGGFRSHRRRRAAVKTEQDAESADRTSLAKKLRPSSSSLSSAPAYTKPESGFSCAPCGFTTEDKATFMEHIGQHRRGGTEGGDLQCVHCGACFASTSSLSRHRFITHKVRDAHGDGPQDVGAHPSTSSAGAKNLDDRSPLNGSDPASPSSQPATAHGRDEDGALICKVCGKHFEKATDLNTHFRTHGMAFINARNAGKTTS
ncbi:zinc finger protein 687a [Kryptolebias marmoratus]|uniref:zinc finger protein 687a n=1 Tax=Kryptolebias marmoratus TaxID=37003 RepID=UPI000D52F3D6|nr:zinc finger protein 687a [Kryptolebias marmoratus]XP_037836027.1 zinc finger protein 687a [Kryptolebias marmoratus]